MLTVDFEPGLTALTQTAFSDLGSSVITAIPLYILISQIMLKAPAGRDRFDAAQRFVAARREHRGRRRCG